MPKKVVPFKAREISRSNRESTPDSEIGELVELGQNRRMVLEEGIEFSCNTIPVSNRKYTCANKRCHEIAAYEILFYDTIADSPVLLENRIFCCGRALCLAIAKRKARDEFQRS